MIEYADMLFTGEFVHRVDIEGAEKYYKMAADKNNSYAQKNIVSASYFRIPFWKQMFASDLLTATPSPS